MVKYYSPLCFSNVIQTIVYCAFIGDEGSRG